MTSRPNLDFTIRTNPPASAAPAPSAPTPSRPSVLVSTVPSAHAQAHMDAFQAAGIEAAKHAAEAGRRLEAIKAFIADVEKPDIDPRVLFLRAPEIIDADHFKKLCEEVAFSMTGNRDAEAGKRLISENFRLILRIKSYDGLNLLEQTAAFYSFKLENYRAIEKYNELGKVLTKYEDEILKPTLGPQGIKNPQAAATRQMAWGVFHGLPEWAKNWIYYRIWQLDDGGEKGENYGRNKLSEDIRRALIYTKKMSPLKDGIYDCNLSLQKPIKLDATYRHEEGLQAQDSLLIANEIKKLYELENLQHFLLDPFKDDGFVYQKYHFLSSELKTLLDVLIRTAYFEQGQDFSDRMVARKGKILLSITNAQGVDIVTQLIAHQKQKIKGLRIAHLLEVKGKVPAPQILACFDRLPDDVKEELRKRVWERDGGEGNSEINGERHFPSLGKTGYYGTCKIEAEPYTLFVGKPGDYLQFVRTKVQNADKDLLENFTRTRPIPQGPVVVSTARLEREAGLIGSLPEALRVAFITAEFAGVASLGGLASAVDGMVRGISAENSRVIMPLYSGEGSPIRSEIRANLTLKSKYEVEVAGRKLPIHKTKVNGVRIYFIEAHDVFFIPKKADGTAGNFYDGEYFTVKRRWVVFQSAAAELVYRMSKKPENPVNLIHPHDAQSALALKFLAAYHPEEWKKGITPAALFTFHNNLEQNPYDSDETFRILEGYGIHERVNSFIEGLHDADVVTTVSETFGKEAQTDTPLARGVGSFVKKAALEGKMFGIVNGNTNGWDPRTQEHLKKWGLNFGPDSPNLVDIIKAAQAKLCEILKSVPFDDPLYAELDPKKPIFGYVGRYDSNQKGIDKFELMKYVVENGGQFVSFGVEPDPKGRQYLQRMQDYAKARGKKGVLVLIDEKVDGKLKYQQIMALGGLMRLAMTFAIMFSEYEPCGLFQGEMNCFGKKVIATDTGGLSDTLHETGADANGFLIKRFEKWYSPEQDAAILAKLTQVLLIAKAMQKAFYEGTPAEQAPFIQSMKLIMMNALKSTWETTPDGSLSPIRRLELAYAKAFQLRQRRGQQFADLLTLKI